MRFNNICFVFVLFQVGGIKEKVLAAHRAGLKRVIIPKRNEKDLQEIPTNIKVFFNPSSVIYMKTVFIYCYLILSLFLGDNYILNFHLWRYMVRLIR